MMGNSFKTAFLISNLNELPEWEIEMIRNLRNSGVVTIDAFIIVSQTTEEKKSSGVKFFQKFENCWFRSVQDAFRKSAVSKEFSTVPVIDITENKKVLALSLDIIYCSCLVAVKDEFIPFARHGLWYIGFGSDNSSNYNEVAFWEVMNNSPEIGSALLVKLAETSEIITILKGTTTTVPYSVKNTLNIIGWKSSSFLSYRLSELSKMGADLFFSKYKKSGKGVQKETLINSSKYPGNLKLSALFIRNIARYLGSKFSKFFGEKKFTLLFSRQEFKIPGVDFNSFTPLKLPKGTFWADPFVIEKEQKTYIFFEEFLYEKRKAHISVLELGKDGHYTEPVMVLDKPYHLSYPFIFESEKTLYMIPETSVNKTVELYKCTAFPLKWEFVKNLMEDLVLTDVTLLYHQGKWWLFGTVQNHPSTSTNDQLFLYYSDKFFSSDWTPHPQNPVATIISNCRPAGNIFKASGKLYRPAQNNSSKQYGYAIKINEIEVLNETEYREREVFEVIPDKKNKLSAIHTMNFVDNLIVIDGIV